MQLLLPLPFPFSRKWILNFSVTAKKSSVGELFSHANFEILAKMSTVIDDFFSWQISRELQELLHLKENPLCAADCLSRKLCFPFSAVCKSIGSPADFH